MAEKFGIKYEDSKVKKQGGLDREILEWIQEKEGGIANEYLYFNECSISEKGIQVIVKDNKDTVIIFSPSLALEKCQKEKPELKTVGKKHELACHLKNTNL